MYPPLIVGNWKMNGTVQSVRDLAADIVARTQATSLKSQIVLCPSFAHLSLVNHRLLGTKIGLGAQDCHFLQSGAYTGDTSAAMLADIGCQYVILGHSERRLYYNESNDVIREKALAAHKAGLKTIICIGETQKEREAGETLNIIKSQWYGSLPEDVNVDNTIIAYEPIWAIGTGLIPRVEDLKSVYATLRNLALEKFLQDGQQMRFLYGGSVRSKNIDNLKVIKDIGGVLVGGASLDGEVFFKIALSYN
jgi:triosephosphate isomerase